MQLWHGSFTSLFTSLLTVGLLNFSIFFNAIKSVGCAHICRKMHQTRNILYFKGLNVQSIPDYTNTRLACFIHRRMSVWIAGVLDQQGIKKSGRAEGAETAAATAATRGRRRGGWCRCWQSGGKRLR